ncbi:MAG: DNA integrity scanning protein DisA nucleotide-binding domain protein [Deltaproteobacteria bacterium]|nr:DNA integrity scanning protein DisA nucleotide-binding domain protein [Deltaproteobacteria bacterium]
MELLAQAGWRDALDVGLLALMLSWLYGRLRQSRALGIAMGLAFVAIVALAARETGLLLTGWVLQGTLAIVALGAVTIFAPEIREALLRANPLRALVGRGRDSSHAGLERFARAAFALGSERIGALVVFERREAVASHAQAGIRLDAEASEELLVSLFQKTAPTHDGAVIVRAGRVERAGAVLPLSERADLPSAYGTRHRAALGLSELCDALVLVVSEERGAVSLVSRGRLTTLSGPAALASRLRAELSGGGDALPGARASLLSGWQARLVILVLVALVWMGMRSGGVSSMSVMVPLELGDLPDGTELVEFQPERVRVQVSGAERVMEGLDLTQIRVRADVGDLPPGTHSQPIPIAAAVLPTGVRADSIEPSTVRFLVDRVETRELPVVVVIRRDGKRFASRRLSSEPAVVRVVGALSRLAGLEAVYTETIDAPDLARGTVRAALELPGTLRLAPGEPERVTVSDPAQGGEQARLGR